YSDVEVSEGLFVHFWSLSIEEQFYVVWPVLVLGVGLLAQRWGRRGFELLLGGVVASVVAASFAASVVLTPRGPDAYYLTHVRVWELGVGAGLALLLPRSPRLPRLLAEALAVVGVVMIVVAALVFDSGTPF